MVSAIISLLAALFKAIPSIKDIIAIALERADKSNVAEAFSREEEKNNRNSARIREILNPTSGSEENTDLNENVD